MKISIVLEDFVNDTQSRGCAVTTSVIGAFQTRKLAEKEIGRRLDETCDDITGDDENNESAISEVRPWDGKAAFVESDFCARWSWRIVTEELVVE